MLSQLRFLISLVNFVVPALATSVHIHPRAPQANCKSCAPNPIADIYPNNATGTINATTSIIVVPISYARSLLPSRLAPLILTHAYTRFSVPPTHYPLLLENTIDHDIRFQGINAVADFSSLRLSFPFVNLLGDKSTCFRYISYIYLPPTVPIATTGAEGYGETVIPATFDPPDAPYRRSSPGKDEYIFKVYPNISQSLHLPPAAFVYSHPAPGGDVFSLAFYKNVTNQPMFGNNSAVCDNMIRFWNTTVSQGVNTPQNVVSKVKLSPPLVEKERIWKDVRGVKATTAFLENNYIPCGMLKGYKGTGVGDSG